MDVFCISPFTRLAIEGSGDMRICCATHHSLSLAPVSQVWKSTEMNLIRRSFQEGKLPDSCSVCHERERVGLESYRQVTNNMWKSSLGMTEAQWYQFKNHCYKEPTLRELDLSFSNICNLTCVMCSSRYSSSWVKYEEKIPKGFSRDGEEYNTKHRIDSQLVDELLEIVGGLERIFIKGGEPLLDPTCHKFLEKLSKTKFNGELWIVTNGTQVNKALLKTLDSLKSVNFSMSVDGTGLINEWIRGSSFSLIEKTFVKFHQLKSLDKLAIQMTISAYNIFNICEFMTWEQSLKKGFSKFIGAEFAQCAIQTFLNSQNIPLDMRTEVQTRISEVHLEKYKDGHLQNLFRYLEIPEHPREKLKAFFAWSDYCNRMRSLDIFKIEPKFQLIRERAECVS